MSMGISSILHVRGYSKVIHNYSYILAKWSSRVMRSQSIKEFLCYKRKETRRNDFFIPFPKLIT